MCHNDPMAYDPLTVRYYTVEEIADLLKVSKMHVYRAVHNGELPSVPISPKIFRIPEPALRTWLGDTSPAS